MARKCESLK